VLWINVLPVSDHSDTEIDVEEIIHATENLTLVIDLHCATFSGATEETVVLGSKIEKRETPT
jgi:hypothetical protein